MNKGSELRTKALAALEDKKAHIRENDSYQTAMDIFEESAEQGYMERWFSQSRMEELFGKNFLNDFNLLKEVFANDGITLNRYYSVYSFSWE